MSIHCCRKSIGYKTKRKLPNCLDLSEQRRNLWTSPVKTDDLNVNSQLLRTQPGPLIKINRAFNAPFSANSQQLINVHQ